MNPNDLADLAEHDPTLDYDIETGEVTDYSDPTGTPCPTPNRIAVGPYFRYSKTEVIIYSPLLDGSEVYMVVPASLLQTRPSLLPVCMTTVIMFAHMGAPGRVSLSMTLDRGLPFPDQITV